MLFDEEGGEERKIQGEEMDLLLCQGMPLTEIEGHCFLLVNSFGPWDSDDGAARATNVSASSAFSQSSARREAGALSSSFFAVNYVLKVPLRRGMCERLSDGRALRMCKGWPIIGWMIKRLCHKTPHTHNQTPPVRALTEH